MYYQFQATNDEGQKFFCNPIYRQHLSSLKKLVPFPAEYTSVKDLYPAQFKNELWAHVPLVMCHQQSFHLTIQQL